MIITLMGTPSAGKSYLARKVAEHYGLTHYSIGDLRRKAAADKGMTLAEFNKLGESGDTDTAFDAFQKRLGETEDDFVIDARLGAFFLPHSIKVFVDASEEVRAKRMLVSEAEHPRIGESPKDVQEATRLMRERVASDKKRYARHYGYDPYNPAAYDLILDTTHLGKKESVEELIVRIEEYRAASGSL